MSIESSLSTLLRAICARTYPDVAPTGAALPYITWQGIGGETLRYFDKTAVDKRNTLMQIAVQSTTRLEANTLIRQVEDALCADTGMTVLPQGEPVSLYEEDTKIYRAVQRFSIFCSR